MEQKKRVETEPVKGNMCMKKGVSLKGFWLLKERGILYEHGKGK
jgi:hypothetical protein